MNTKSLTNELVINDDIPGSTDHNGGRLVIGPIFNNMDYIFYGVGDMGAGHLGNAERAHRGQIRNIYEGKILRFNLIPDGDTSSVDSWILTTIHSTHKAHKMQFGPWAIAIHKDWFFTRWYPL